MTKKEDKLDETCTKRFSTFMLGNIYKLLP